MGYLFDTMEEFYLKVLNIFKENLFYNFYDVTKTSWNSKRLPKMIEICKLKVPYTCSYRHVFPDSIHAFSQI
jgi:hypothetical protein